MPVPQPIPTSSFYVEFDGLTDKQVKKISGVTMTAQTAGHEKALASGKGGMTKWQSTSSGFEENPSMTLEVYLAKGDMEFYNWLKAIMPKSAGGEGKWAENRKNGSVVAYGPDGNEVLRWDMTGALIKSYKVSDFSGDSKELAVETLEFVMESINRVT